MTARLDAFRQALRELCAAHRCIPQVSPAGEIVLYFHDLPTTAAGNPLKSVTLVEDRL